MSLLTCPRCQGKIDDDSLFCKHRAFDLSKAKNTSPAMSGRNSRSQLIAGSVAIFTALCIIVLGSMVVKHNLSSAKLLKCKDVIAITSVREFRSTNFVSWCATLHSIYQPQT